MCPVLQLLEHLRPELELRLDIEPGDDEAWEEIIDGAAEGIEEMPEELLAPDVWVRASTLHSMECASALDLGLFQ